MNVFVNQVHIFVKGSNVKLEKDEECHKEGHFDEIPQIHRLKPDSENVAVRANSTFIFTSIVKASPNLKIFVIVKRVEHKVFKAGRSF